MKVDQEIYFLKIHFSKYIEREREREKLDKLMNSLELNENQKHTLLVNYENC